jgi:hypothetical protein
VRSGLDGDALTAQQREELRHRRRRGRPPIFGDDFAVTIERTPPAESITEINADCGYSLPD